MTQDTADSLCIVAVFAVISLAVSVPIVHYNYGEHELQSQCIRSGGNWETREHSDRDGCRFPVKK